MEDKSCLNHPPLAIKRYNEEKSIDIDFMLDLRNCCNNMIVNKQSLKGLDFDTTKRILEYEINGVDEVLDIYNSNRQKNGKH